jgi:hypothetical protein
MLAQGHPRTKSRREHGHNNAPRGGRQGAERHAIVAVSIHMSDDDEDDGPLVEQAARDLAKRHGPKAAEIARERADVADALDDPLAAKTWRDIADAIDRLQAP